jgi:hypothetical protein
LHKQAIVTRLAPKFGEGNSRGTYPLLSFMPKTKLSKSEGKRLLEETKQRLRLQQEARTIARIEQLEIEACEMSEF